MKFQFLEKNWLNIPVYYNYDQIEYGNLHAIRNVRKDANDKIKKLEKDKLVTEDESKKAHDEVQKITDSFVDKIDGVFKEKEAELLKV